MIQLFQSSKYYVSASEYEGMPLTMLEAMSCGCIPIVSNIPGHKELAKPVEKMNNRQIAGFVKKNYDWSKIAKKYEKVFKNG